jgi:hypothetical protein
MSGIVSKTVRKSATAPSLAIVLTALAAWCIGSGRAAAVPSFAVQTGLQCSACHVGGFGPQLTPMGREFKLHGYTSRTKDFNLPFSAMAQASYVHTAKDQASPPADHYDVNDNVSIDQVSLFIAGGIGSHFGMFSQTTYDGVGRSFSWDNTDLRAVTTVSLKGADTVLGLSLNNNPGVQDAWNTLPAWGFPYTTSALAPSPSTAPMIDGGFAQNVIGLTAYALIEDRFYLEAGAYGSMSPGFLKAVGVDPGETSRVHGLAPYARVAYQKNYGLQNFEVGAFGLWSHVYPGRDESAGTTDAFEDMGVDGSFQKFFADHSVITAQARYTHERQQLRASAILGNAANVDNTVEEIAADLSYYWKNKVGLTVGPFDTWGSPDAVIYSGNRVLKPDSDGVMVQLDGTPWGDGGGPFGQRFNMRVGVQYTFYGRFEGASHNYDGLGHNASDNNTLRVFSWIAF